MLFKREFLYEMAPYNRFSQVPSEILMFSVFWLLSALLRRSRPLSDAVPLEATIEDSTDGKDNEVTLFAFILTLSLCTLLFSAKQLVLRVSRRF